MKQQAIPVLAAATLAAVLLTSCGSGDQGASPSGPPNSSSSTPARTTDAPVSPSTPVSPSGSSPSGSGGATRPPCMSVPVRPFGATTLDEGPLAKALLLRDLAIGCRADSLAAIATTDRTALSFGGIGPQEAFALPQRADDNRYDALIALLSLSPATEVVNGSTIHVGPRVHTEADSTDDAAWQEVIDAGLVTRDEAQRMRAAEGYLGYRLGIGADGSWRYLIAGD